jgi:hypothetical protein
VQRLEVLRGIRVRLTALAGQLVDGPRCLREQVQQFEANRTGECLAHHGNCLEQGGLALAARHFVAIQAIS